MAPLKNVPARLLAAVKRLQASMFVIPMFGVVLAIGAGFGCLAIDGAIDWADGELPFGLTSTVESARAVLSTIAAATISFAGVAFSISLLTIQLALNQYSPRIVHTLFRDPFTKHVLAIVVGTFTYCLVVLRSVRSSLESGGDPVIPNISVAVAVVLAITTILAIVAFIDHSAHGMDVSELLHRVSRDAMNHVHRNWRPAGSPRPPTAPPPDGSSACTIRFDGSGWVQRVDGRQLLRALPPRTAAVLHASAGRYAIAGTPLCTISPPVEDVEPVAAAVRAGIVLGPARTLQQDAAYGLRQLADVALRALSPGINDPTTAQEAMFHAASVIGEILVHDPPEAEIRGDDGRRVHLAEQPTGAQLVSLAFDEVRRASADKPAVCAYLLDALGQLVERLTAAGLGERTAALVEQARLIVRASEHIELPVADREAITDAFARSFPA